MGVSVTVTRAIEPVGYNQLSGVVTWVFEGGTLNEGDAAYSVSGVPVRVVQGNVPFYRTLGQGSSGDDVRQVQEALTRLGFLADPADGDWGPATTSAMRAWQRSLGADPSGAAPLGELIALATLPTAVQPADELRAGAPATIGEPVMFGTSQDAEFALVLSDDQARRIVTGSQVEIAAPDGEQWPAVVMAGEAQGDGTVRLVLEHPDGGLPCRDACGSLPLSERLTLAADVVTVPDVTGSAVPVAAVRTVPDGATYLVDEAGRRIDVVVLASQGGVAVVEGIVVGQTVRLFGEGGG